MFELIPIFENVQEVYQKALIFSTFINLSRWSDFEDLFISNINPWSETFFSQIIPPSAFRSFIKTFIKVMSIIGLRNIRQSKFTHRTHLLWLCGFDWIISYHSQNTYTLNQHQSQLGRYSMMTA